MSKADLPSSSGACAAVSASGARLSDLIEGHHRGLHALILRVQQSPTDSHGLKALEDFALTHFAYEEKLMEDVSYSGLQEHQVHHQQFLLWVRALQTTEADAHHAAALSGETAEDLALSLARWWDEHSRTHDLLLTEFLCRGGI